MLTNYLFITLISGTLLPHKYMPNIKLVQKGFRNMQIMYLTVQLCAMLCTYKWSYKRIYYDNRIRKSKTTKYINPI